MHNKHVVIVGGVIIGLCTAYYASLRGHHVTLVERGNKDGDCCSIGNAGLVCPSHFIPLAAPGAVRAALAMMRDPASPFSIEPRMSWELLAWGWRFWRAANAAHVSRSAPLLRDLHLASRAEYEAMAGLCENKFGLTRNGLLMLCKTHRRFEEEAGIVPRAAELGIAAELLDARQAAAREPALAIDVAGAICFPADCHLAPQRLMPVLREMLERAGISLRWNTELTGWTTRNGRIDAAQTTAGELRADEYVLCGGSWSGRCAKGLNLRLPMQPGKGYSLTLPQPRRLPRIPALLAEARVAVTPMGASLRFAGTMEMSGFNHRIDPRRVRGIVDAVPRYYPQITPADFEGVAAWCGLRPCSPDGLPYLGRTRRYTNLCIATGHAMMGISLGPISGRIIAQLLSDEPPEIDITLLDPDRYA